LLEGLLDAFEAGMDGEGEAVAVAGLTPLTEVCVAVAHAGHGTEVLRHEGEGGFAVVDGFGEAFGEVIGDGALVAGFGEVGVFGDGLGEFFDGAGVIAVVEVGIAALHECDSAAIAEAEPDGPESVLSHLGDHGVGVVEGDGEGLDGGTVSDVATGAGFGLARDHGKCERGDFSHIGGFVFEEGDDLGDGPAGLDAAQGLFEGAFIEGGLNRGDEFLGAGRRRRGFNG